RPFQCRLAHGCSQSCRSEGRQTSPEGANSAARAGQDDNLSAHSGSPWLTAARLRQIPVLLKLLLTSYRPVSKSKSRMGKMIRSTAIKNLPKPSDGSDRVESIRRVIYERATDLFLAKGFTKTSMNEIAAACGV